MDNDTIIQKITEIATIQKTAIEDIKVLYKKTNEINNLYISISTLTSSVNDLKIIVSKLTDKVEIISERPNEEKAKNWDSVIKTSIGTIVGGLAGYFLFKLGLK